jgi:isorenieratene synthase
LPRLPIRKGSIGYQHRALLGRAQSPAQSPKPWNTSGRAIGSSTLAPGADRALSLTCTHQGCRCSAKQVERAAGGYQCPCHGAVYASDGTVLAGPAQENLAQYQVLQRQGDQQVQLVAKDPDPEAMAEHPLTADYYIMAADIPGIKALFSLSQGDPNANWSARSMQLQVADPFAVGRFWFDRDFDWEHSWFTSLSGYRLTDSITLYHRIQDDYIDWAERTGGSVVELHAYCYKETEFPTQEDLLNTFQAECIHHCARPEGGHRATPATGEPEKLCRASPR